MHLDLFALRKGFDPPPVRYRTDRRQKYTAYSVSDFCSKSSHHICTAPWCNCSCHERKKPSGSRESYTCQAGNHGLCKTFPGNADCSCECHEDDDIDPEGPPPTGRYKYKFANCAAGVHADCTQQHICGCECHEKPKT